MNVQEFKEKYPHLSHLEGDALWNAMEDSYLYEHRNDKPKVITDYLGNEVKDGMDICFITVIDKQQFRFMGYMIGGEMKGSLEPERPDKPCFEKGEFYHLNNGLNYTKKHGGITYTAPLSMLTFGQQPTQILAIKGISDTEEQYNEYLKTKSSETV